MENVNVKSLQERVALQRDQQAYKALFLHFYKVLTPFALTLLKSKQSAEEVVSDVMLNIWQIEDRLMAVQDLKVYLLRAVKNRAINHLTRSRHFQSFDGCEKEGGLHDNSADPHERLQKEEMQRCLRQAIKSLPPRCGMVYHLVKEEGLSYREVAGIMSISENTVDRQLNNALHKLIGALRSYLHEGPAEKNFKPKVGRATEAGVMEK